MTCICRKGVVVGGSTECSFVEQVGSVPEGDHGY